MQMIRRVMDGSWSCKIRKKENARVSRLRAEKGAFTTARKAGVKRKHRPCLFREKKNKGVAGGNMLPTLHHMRQLKAG